MVSFSTTNTAKKIQYLYNRKLELAHSMQVIDSITKGEYMVITRINTQLDLPCDDDRAEVKNKLVIRICGLKMHSRLVKLDIFIHIGKTMLTGFEKIKSIGINKRIEKYVTTDILEHFRERVVFCKNQLDRPKTCDLTPDQKRTREERRKMNIQNLIANKTFVKKVKHTVDEDKNPVEPYITQTTKDYKMQHKKTKNVRDKIRHQALTQDLEAIKFISKIGTMHVLTSLTSVKNQMIDMRITQVNMDLKAINPTQTIYVVNVKLNHVSNYDITNLAITKNQ